MAMTTAELEQARKRAALPSGQTVTVGLNTAFNQDTFDVLARQLCARPEHLRGLGFLARTTKALNSLVSASVAWEDLYRAVAGSNASEYLRRIHQQTRMLTLNNNDHSTVEFTTFNTEQGLHAAFSHAAVATRVHSPACWRRACEMLLSKACKDCGAMSAIGELE